jgi:hypothetical protein
MEASRYDNTKGASSRSGVLAMSLCPHHRLVPLALLLGLGLVAPARAADGVEDGAGLFSRAARIKADDAIEDIHRRTHKDILIETVRKLPEARLKEYRALKTPADRARFFQSLAEERARRADVDGVCVLLCRAPAEEEPRHGLSRFLPRAMREQVEPQVVGRAVIVWPASNDASFSEKARDRLDALFADIKPAAHNQDKVLLEAVTFAGDELQANVRGAPPIDTIRWTDAVWAAAALAGAWVVLGAVRVRVAARQGTPAPVPGAEQALAAQFGASAALWLFEAYRAGRRADASASVPPAATEPSHSADTEMHPDDLAALGRVSGAWAAEDAEAMTGHDLP